jgi:hypothetical protein
LPALAAGTYELFVWCGACASGRLGSLIGDPHRKHGTLIEVRP